MKFIHTADWHIGKIINEFSMLEEQKIVLKQLLGIMEQQKPDALIIAGDVYDRSIPPVEAVELVDDIFCTILLDMKIPVLVIAGNHDGAERLSFASKILTDRGLHIVGKVTPAVQKVTLADQFGPVNFYMLPYADPRYIRNMLEDSAISTHDDAMRAITGPIRQQLDTSCRNIMITHGYITYMGQDNASTCESERPLSIGGTDFVSTSHFDGFNYTALGHLHGNQKTGNDCIRYSGSLMKYSFSEVNHKKGVNIVELDKAGQAAAAFSELVPSRDMRIIKGPIKELLSPGIYKSANPEDYIYAVLTDREELVDPISKLRTVYPNIMGLTRENGNSAQDSRTAASAGYKTKSRLELFNEFFYSIKGEPLGEDSGKVVARIIEDVEREGF